MKLFKKRSVEPVQGIIPPPRTYEWNTNRALSLSAVYRSVSILSTACGQLSGGVWKGQEQLRKVPLWIRQPDPKASFSAFVEESVNSLALHGNAYWRVFRDQRGDVIAIKNLNPTEVHPFEDQGNTYYNYGDQTLTENDIQHLKLLRIAGAIEGLGPIQAARYELMGNLDLVDYQAQWFRGTGVPSGVLSSDFPLSKEAADDYLARWEEKMAQSQTVVLGSGLKYSPTLLTPKDALFLEMSEYGIAQVARLFGIPSIYLQVGIEGNSTTYTNLQEADRSFLRYTLMSYVVEMEEAFSSLLPRGTNFKLDTSNLLRTGDAERYEAMKLAIESGILSVNEVRMLEGLTPRTDEELKAIESGNDTNG